MPFPLCSQQHTCHVKLSKREDDTRSREEVGCGGNENIEMVVWSHNVGQIRDEIIRGTTKVAEIYKKVQESRLKED